MERDIDGIALKNNDTDFNSHAHVERDLAVLDDIDHLIKISTHTLTWSVTGKIYDICFFMPISTHTLTWSVTIDINVGAP